MNFNSINMVTAFIYFIVLWHIIKGFRNRFSKEEISVRMINWINAAILMISMSFSLYIVYRALFSKNDMLHSFIYSVLTPEAIKYIESETIVVFLLSAVLITALIHFILVGIRSLADKALFNMAEHLSSTIGGWNKPIRMAAGVASEIPSAFVSLLAVVLLLNACITYQPNSIIAVEGAKSKPYKYIYSSGLSPAINSRTGKMISSFVWKSLGELAGQAEGTVVLNKQYDINTLGLLRFSIEAKSNDQIDNKARKIVGNEKDEVKKAYLLYKWIGDNVSYDWDKYNDILNNQSFRDKFGAINAYETRKGVCEDYADLYVAMARAAGLKVRLIVGQGFDGNQWTGHAWNQVYISKTGKWISLDTTWASAGYYFNTKNFDKTHTAEAIAGEW